MTVRRALALPPAALAVLLALISLAGPAAADRAEPGFQRSTVLILEPPVTSLRADVVGGDGFLRLRVDRGHEVLVLGYEGEPYLRVLTDGAVEENRRSPARALNADRYGDVEPDPTADAAAPPEWEHAGGGGLALWHDHRIHWMARTTPPVQVEADGTRVVSRWVVPLIVDGAPVELRGLLVDLPARDASPWIAGWAAGAALLVLLGLWRTPAVLPPLVIAAGGALGTTVAQLARLPDGARPAAATMLLPGLGLAGAVLATVAIRWRWLGVPLLAASGAAVALWGAEWSVTWTRPVLVEGVPDTAQRVAAAVAVGAGVAAVVVGVVRVVWPDRGRRRRGRGADDVGLVQPGAAPDTGAEPASLRFHASPARASHTTRWPLFTVVSAQS